MGHNFDYTGTVKNFASKYPFLNFVFVQIIFWVSAEVLLALVLHLMLSAMSQSFPLPRQSNLFFTRIFIGVTLGLLYGILFGAVDYFFDRQYFRRLSLGLMLLIKAGFSILLFITQFALLRYFLFYRFIRPEFQSDSPVFNEEFWKYLFLVFFIYNSVMIILINLINQVNKKYGPGVLLPLLLGKYRTPKVEERIFMFMDLKSSTTIAETLGHIKYSSFIRDSFMDINLMLNKFKAEVYQYVGDEMVLTWTLKNGLKDHTCLKFFFACNEQFRSRSEYYINNYNVLPNFKAGVHMGKITTVEIGEIKRDIAYHGDTINTTARIQSICNEHKKNLLISKFLLDNLEEERNYKANSLGMILLKGKHNPLEIVSIEL